jgi:Ca2+/Na+ antiporter
MQFLSCHCLAKLAAFVAGAADFYRDTIIYIMLIAAVILICMDGHISLVESVVLMGIYALYIFAVVVLSRMRLKKQPIHRAMVRSEQQAPARTAGVVRRLGNGGTTEQTGVAGVAGPREREPLLPKAHDSVNQPGGEVAEAADTNSESSIYESCDDSGSEDEENLDAHLPGVVWVSSAGLLTKIQFVLEYPFSLLRCASIPSVDPETWGPRHRWIVVLWPAPFIVVMVIALQHYQGFVGWVDNLPILSLPFILGTCGPTQRRKNDCGSFLTVTFACCTKAYPSPWSSI